MIRVRPFTAMVLSLLLTAAPMTEKARAQDYPDRPVKIIVPTPPGGPVDVIARITANYLQNTLGKAFVLENRAGACARRRIRILRPGAAARGHPSQRRRIAVRASRRDGG